MPVSRFNKSLRVDFVPLIQQDGWVKLTARKFGRIRRDVFQWIAISVDGRGGTKRVLVEFGTQPLSARAISVSMNVGGRFWTGSSEWRAIRNEEGAERVVQAMCEEWKTRICDWMESALDLSGFKKAIDSKEIANPPYDRFYVACLCADRGELEEARSSFLKAKQCFDDTFSQNSYAEWAQEHSGLCDLAIARIEGRGICGLLAEWRLFSYRELDLEKWFGAAETTFAEQDVDPNA